MFLLSSINQFLIVTVKLFTNLVSHLTRYKTFVSLNQILPELQQQNKVTFFEWTKKTNTFHYCTFQNNINYCDLILLWCLEKNTIGLISEHFNIKSNNAFTYKTIEILLQFLLLNEKIVELNECELKCKTWYLNPLG